MSEPETTPAKPRRVARSRPPSKPRDDVEPTSSGMLESLVAPALAKEAKAATRTLQPVATVFFLCLAIGAVLSLFGLMDDPLLRTIGVLGPVAMTTLYPLWGYVAGLHRQPSQRERFADNCYYLGFIFTQVALVVGFLPVALFDKVIESQDVLRFFGVALGASLVGLVARTLFVQAGHTVSESADIVEQEVDQVAHAIALQSKQVLREFDAVTKGLGATYRKLNDELEGCVSAVAGTLQSYERTLVATLASLEAQTKQIGAGAESARDWVAAEQGALAAALQSAASAVENLRGGLHEQVTAASTAIRESAEALSAGAGALQGFGALSQRVEALDGRLAGVTEQIGGLDRTVSTAADALTAASRGAVERTEAALQQSQAGAAEMTQRLRTQTEAVTQALEEALQGFRTELERIRG
jgi:hypothetical protein